jgi:hypothetical protein
VTQSFNPEPTATADIITFAVGSGLNEEMVQSSRPTAIMAGMLPIRSATSS